MHAGNHVTAAADEFFTADRLSLCNHVGQGVDYFLRIATIDQCCNDGSIGMIQYEVIGSQPVFLIQTGNLGEIFHLVDHAVSGKGLVMEPELVRSKTEFADLCEFVLE